MDTAQVSLAHRQSSSFIIDPAYCTPTVDRSGDCQEEKWHYGDAELECYRLALLRKRVTGAELNVYYPGSYHIPVCKGFFRFEVKSRDQNISLRSNGKVTVRAGTEVVYESEQDDYDTCPDTLHNVVLRNCKETDSGVCIAVQVITDQDNSPPEPPCLCVIAPAPATHCEWSTTGTSNWSPTKIFSALSPLSPPHLEEKANLQIVRPQRQIGDHVYDFGCELLGHVVFELPQDWDHDTVQLQVGETIQEALNSDPKLREQSTAIVKTNDFTQMWQSAHLLAFRYVKVQASDVSCKAHFHPVQYHGAFAASDNVLTKIWMSAAYTLRLCMHDSFIVDGIKRDRLPWTGDLAVSLLANAYTFNDKENVRRTLTALGRNGIEECDVNGIVDYSLWWIVTQDLYQLYYGDMDHLNREWSRIEDAVNCLIKRCSDDTGFLEIDKDRHWVFVDWVDSDKSTALQILFWWALECAAKLANRQNHRPIAMQWRKWQDKVKESLVELCWDKNARLWLGTPNQGTDYSRHANILAVISGLSSKKNDSIAKALLGTAIAPVGTPYMKFFECMALTYLSEDGIGEMRSYWAGMLAKGATTFFEAFDISENDVASFYGRRFGRSLCHAWSAGPAQFFPATILGIRPLQDGWKEWTCRINLDGLDFASASVPTPFGRVEVEASGEHIQVAVPNGTTFKVEDASYAGPMTLEFKPEDLREHNFVDYDTLRAWSAPYRNWHYYPCHVIPSSPQISAPDIQMTDVPTVYQLPNDKKWYMSFIGFDGKGYQSFVAESIDLVTWTNFRLAMGYGKEGDFDYGGRVLGAFLYEDYNVESQRVLKRKDGKFWSLYGAYEKRGGYEIDPGYEGLASSNDGLTWERAKEDFILSVHSPDAGDWERSSIYQPWLLEHNGQFLNFYNAKQTPPWTEQIGLAASEDLFNWKRHEDNPVLAVCPNTFDSQFVADGKVFRDGNKWVMFYFGVGPTWNVGAHIQVAFSMDLIHWHTNRQPLYRAGGHPTGLDKEHAHKISLIWNPANETWYMYYCAVGNKGRGIGLLTSKPIDGSLPV